MIFAEIHAFMTFHQLVDDHVKTLYSIRQHLSLRISPELNSPPIATLRKATPDRLCEAVVNYEELCLSFRTTEYSGFFEQPCDCNLLRRDSR